MVSRGKHLLHRVEGGLTLHSHLRMEGQWADRGDPGAEARLAALTRPARLAWPHGTGLPWGCGGMLDLVETAREAELVGPGPGPARSDWDAARAVDNLVDAAVPIGEALLDQRNLAGLGTSGRPRRSSCSGCRPGPRRPAWSGRSSSWSWSVRTASSTAVAEMPSSRRPAQGPGGRRPSCMAAAADRAGAAARSCGSRPSASPRGNEPCSTAPDARAVSRRPTTAGPNSLWGPSRGRMVGPAAVAATDPEPRRRGRQR